MKIPRLVAHRGYMSAYPENSRTGLLAALQAGACFVEFDVQLNADGDFVVIHDVTFKRTAGLDRSVFDVRTPDCDSISVHEPKRFGDRFAPEPVPRLADILDMIHDYPDATALVEIKQESLDHWGLAPVMDRLLGSLADHAGQCVLISFADEAIAYARQHSSLPTGWVLQRYDEHHRQRALQLQADYLMCNYKKLPRHKPPWEEFKRWMLYDITDPELAIRYARQGIELIETADIGGMLEHPMLKTMACRHGL